MLFVVWITSLIGLSFAMWFASLLVDFLQAYRAGKPATAGACPADAALLADDAMPVRPAARVLRPRPVTGVSRLHEALRHLATQLNLLPVRHKLDVRMFR